MNRALLPSLVGTVSAALTVCACSSNDSAFFSPRPYIGDGGVDSSVDAKGGDSATPGEAGDVSILPETGQGGAGGSGGAAGAAGSGGGAAGTSSGGRGGGAPDGWDANFGYDSPTFDANFQDACVDENVEADPPPLDIYFLLDASTSMSEPVGMQDDGDCNATPPFSPANNSKWCKAVNAIAGYVSSPEAAGNRAAIQYFKHYTAHNCNGNGYSTPAVPLGDLPGNYSGHAQTIVEASPGGLNWAYPYSNTPTEGALRGLAAFTAANQTPGRVIIGILVTDGAPTACATGDALLKGIAQTHFNNTGIQTFMVGMTGANFTRLENWASYTGALPHDDANNACGNCNNCTCHHYNVGDGDPAVFIQALKQIQKAVLSCTFKVPTPSQGVLDPDLVKVEYLAGGQPPAAELPRVSDAAACNGPGWYYEYDANNNPTTINLCPDSCTTVQADANAQIKIRIACQGT